MYGQEEDHEGTKKGRIALRPSNEVNERYYPPPPLDVE